MTNQRGGISLLTTIVISILLTLICVSMAGLMVGELRQAEDSDQSIRAYFAAEAGVEDALLTIQNAPGHNVAAQDTCSTTQVGSNPTLAYTCQLIKIDKNEVVGTRQREDPVQINPGTTAWNQLRISWHQQGRDSELPSSYSPPAPNFPTGSSWAYPAAMEITALSFPTSGITPASPTSASGIQTRVALVYPESGSISTAVLRGFPAAATNPYVGGYCDRSNVVPSQGYFCQVTMDVSPIPNVRIVRIRPRYTGANYKIEFLDSAGNSVPVRDQTATIDVTAKAGDVYRRVQANVALSANAAPGLDYVIYSDTDICKDFQIVSGTAQPGAGSPCGIP